MNSGARSLMKQGLFSVTDCDTRTELVVLLFNLPCRTLQDVTASICL